MSVLKLEVRPGESVTIGDGVVLTLEEKSGQIARLSFEADKSIPIRKVDGAPAKIAAMAGLGGVDRRY
jgi:sRNA-binding carbon storage regulator CsrA